MHDGNGGPARKKQKLSAMSGPAITVTRLAKYQLQLDEELSPGAVHSNRVAVQARRRQPLTAAALPPLLLTASAADAAPPRFCALQSLSGDDDSYYHAYLASGRRIMAMAAPRPAAGLLGARGKGGAFLPEAAHGASWDELPTLALRAEVQDLQLAEDSGGGVLAAVDCYGRATVAHMRRDGGGNANDIASAGRMQVVGIEQLQPEEVAVEAGWAGVALAPGQPTQVAVARHFPKDVTIFDGPLAVRTIHTLYRPNAVRLLPPGLASSVGGAGVVAVAEGPLLSVWDLRAAGRGARVAKLNGGVASGHLYCIAAAEGAATPLLGAAGADRSVMVWDSRTWTAVDRWSNCLKYEATALHFSAADASHCVACGLDYEVVVGRWGGQRRSRLGGGHRTAEAAAAGGAGGGGGGGGGNSGGDRGGHASFRGDSRWMGLGRAQGQDVLAGVTASAQLYTAELGVDALL